MIDTAHLDRTQKFIDWLEERRREAGMTQEELAEAGGISHSYYTKLVSLKTLRARSGDGSRAVVAPRDPRGLYGVLDALSERLGGHIHDEGLAIWGQSPPALRVPHRANGRESLLGSILVKLHALPDEKLHLVSELTRHLSD